MPYTLENDLNDLNDQIGLTFSEKRLKVAHIEPLLSEVGGFGKLESFSVFFQNPQIPKQALEAKLSRVTSEQSLLIP